MKTILKISNRETDENGEIYYEDIKIEINNPSNIIPRIGERITAYTKSYDILNIYYNFDKMEIILTVR